MHFRPMPILSVLSVIGLAILFWLGSWQWARYNEKLNLPEVIPDVQMVSLNAQPLDVPVQYLYTTYNGEPIWRALVAMRGCVTPTTASDCETPYFVDVALLNTLTPDVDAIALPETPDQQLIVHENSRYKPFGAPERSGAQLWYIADAAAMAEALDFSGAVEARILEPKMISVLRKEADGSVRSVEIENPYANPAKLDDLPPARHLGYALTWFGLAATLIGVYLAFHISTGRLRFGGKRQE